MKTFKIRHVDVDNFSGTQGDDEKDGSFQREVFIKTPFKCLQGIIKSHL